MKKLEPISSMHDIPYPVLASEFEVQAYLYSALRAISDDCRGEVHVYGAQKPSGRKSQCRFDLVIFEAQKASLVVEVKARNVRHKRGVENTRQCQRYRRFGVPVHFVYGIDDATEFVQTCARARLESETKAQAGSQPA